MASDTNNKISTDLYNKLSVAKTDTARVNIFLDLNLYHRYINLDSSFIYARKAYNLSVQTGYKEAETAYALGVAYDMFNEYTKAKEYYIEAYKKAEKADDKRTIGAVFNAMGTNYALLNEMELSLTYFKKALPYCYNYNSKFNTLFNIGQVHSHMENFDEAFKYLNQALKLAESNYNKPHIAQVYTESGEIYYYKKEYQKSLDNFQYTFDLLTPEYSYLIVGSMLGMAKSYIKTGNPEEAVRINLLVDSIAEETQLRREQKEACFALSGLYDSLNKPELSLKYYKKYSALKDSIFNLEKSKQLNFLNIEFETAQKEQEIKSLKKQAKMRKMLNISYIIVALLVIIISFYLSHSYKQRNKILLLEKERLTEQKEKEKLKQEKLKLELFEKDREILTQTMLVSQQKEMLSTIQHEISNIINVKENNHVPSSIKRLNSELKTKINVTDDWRQIKLHFEKVHPQFFSNLKSDFPELSLTDLKMCAYSKIRLTIKEISRLLNINPKSVQVSRSRLKKKLNIPEKINFDDYIANRN